MTAARDAAAARDALRALFPEEVVTEGGATEGPAGELHPEEDALVAASIAKRRREFRAGRLYAHVALARLGVASGPILAEERRPVWPEGVVGTISHAHGVCAVATARRGDIVGLGLDIETADGVGARLHRQILTPRERVWVRRHRRTAKWATLIFSAKEAFYKSLADLRSGYLGFRAVRIEPSPETGTFEVWPLAEDPGAVLRGLTVTGRYRIVDGKVLTGVTVRAREGGPAPLSSGTRGS